MNPPSPIKFPKEISISFPAKSGVAFVITRTTFPIQEFTSPTQAFKMVILHSAASILFQFTFLHFLILLIIIAPLEPTSNNKILCVAPIGKGNLVNGFKFGLLKHGTVTSNIEFGRFIPSYATIFKENLSSQSSNSKEEICAYVVSPHIGFSRTLT